MTQAKVLARHLLQGHTFLCTFAAVIVLFTAPVQAQDEETFDPISVSAELDQLASQLADEGVEPPFLAAARTQVIAIDAAADVCLLDATEEFGRLQARFEPLKDVQGDVAPAVMDQRNELRQLLDDALARQTQCGTVKDYAGVLLQRITNRQTQLSQQYLSSRSQSIISLMRDLPARVQTWPARLRQSVVLQLNEGVAPVQLFWLLILAGGVAAALGIFLRHRFNRWFAAGGGHDAEPKLKYLFPKPLAQYSPLLLEGAALVTVLLLMLQDSSLDLAVVRMALGILLYGVACVIIDKSGV